MTWLAVLYLHAAIVYLATIAVVRILGRSAAPWLYTAYTVMMQIFATRLGVYGPLVIPQGTALYTATLATMDMTVASMGKSVAYRLVVAGFAVNALLAAMPYILVTAPPAFPDDAWRQVMMSVPRIVVASLLAYLVGEAVNVALTHKYINVVWKRTFLSDPLASVLDSAVFVTVAFAGTIPATSLLATIAGLSIAKVLLAPLNYVALRLTRKVVG